MCFVKYLSDQNLNLDRVVLSKPRILLERLFFTLYRQVQSSLLLFTGRFKEWVRIAATLFWKAPFLNIYDGNILWGFILRGRGLHRKGPKGFMDLSPLSTAAEDGKQRGPVYTQNIIILIIRTPKRGPLYGNPQTFAKKLL